MRITHSLLVSVDACPKQVELFDKTFPRSAVVTLANCRKAAAAGLDFGFAANHFLSGPQHKAYNEATAAAYKAYDEAIAADYKAYNEARAAAYKAYNEATAAAFYQASKTPKKG